MSEINRVFAHIDGFFEAVGSAHCSAIANVIARCAALAHRGYRERDMEDEALLRQIKNTISKAKALGESPPESVEDRKRVFRDLAIEAMSARRAILPLQDTKRRSTKLDPQAALFDDDDDYAFAIYDTLADEIGELLPDLQKIAVEVSWDADQLE